MEARISYHDEGLDPSPVSTASSNQNCEEYWLENHKKVGKFLDADTSQEELTSNTHKDWDPRIVRVSV